MKEIPTNFRLMSGKIFNMMGKGYVIFSTDSDHLSSIKTMEGQHRGTIYVLRSSSSREPIPKSRQTGKFFSLMMTKKQHIDLLVKEWSKDEYMLQN